MKGRADRAGLLLGCATFLVTAGLLTGCVETFSQLRHPAAADTGPDLRSAHRKGLEESLRTSSDGLDAAAIHLELARIYGYPGNAERNYEKALKHLEAYRDLRPEASSDFRIQNWLGLLTDLQALSRAREDRERMAAIVDDFRQKLTKFEQKLTTLEASARNLETENEALQDENRRLREKIDSLKFLDLRFEEKRRSFK